jgi:flagellar biosynthesis activator protein FlaF
MQHQGALAYQQVARKTEAPRDREANLLSKAAAHLQIVRDDWEVKKSELEAALLFNRRLWNVFLTSVTRQDNPLPEQVRQNIANLGLFVMNETRELTAEPGPGKLTTLININRQLAAGLRGADA